jgi:glycerol-3-phosphate dehydrogenase
VHTNRLAIAFAEGADARGARLVNYAEAVSALKDSAASAKAPSPELRRPGASAPRAAIAGMRVRDVFTGGEIDVRARMTINAAGARAADVMRMFGVNRDVPLVKAVNLVTSRPASDMALAAPGRGGRMLTLVPWQGRALVGTAQSEGFAPAGDLTVTAAEIDAFIADANAAFPALKLTRDEITLVHRGLVPAARGQHGRVDLLGSSEIRDHAGDGAPGSLSVVGVKYTTARAVGARAAAAAAKHLGGSTRRTNTDTAILPGAGISDHEALTIETARAVGLELAPTIVRHLNAIYGDRSAAIVRIMAERSDWRMPLIPGRPEVGGEVIHAIRAEMACTLADIVIRRSELGAMGNPGREIVAAIATIAAEELGWDADRRDREIATVEAFYVLQT